MNITLDQLETFKAVAEQGGLRAASKILNKTQPTLSHAIKNLEEQLNRTLFDRNKYRLELTAEGELFYQKSLPIFEALNDFNSLAKELTDGKEAKIRLAIDHLCPMKPLLRALEKFKKTCGETQIELDFEILSGAQNSLIENKVQLIITPFIDHAGPFEAQQIGSVTLLPVASSKILAKSKTTPANFFKEHPQIVVTENSLTNTKKELPKLNKFGSKEWIVSDHSIKKELISTGFGWGHLEELTVKKELNAGSLRQLKRADLEAKSYPLFIARNKLSPQGIVSKELWSFLDQSFKA